MCTLFLLISTICLNLYCYISVCHALSVSPHEFSFLHLLILISALTQCLRERFFMLRQACVFPYVCGALSVPALARYLSLVDTNLYQSL